MKKFVLALSVLLLASSSASAWPYVVGYAPYTSYYAAPYTSYYAAPYTSYYAAPYTSYYAAPYTSYYAAPVTAYYGTPVTSYYAPAVVSPSYYYGSTVAGYAPYYGYGYGYGYSGYVPGQPVRNLLRAAAW